MNDELRAVVEDYVDNIKRNIELTDNNYTKWAYEITLDILKAVLKDLGFDMQDLFPEEEE